MPPGSNVFPQPPTISNRLTASAPQNSDELSRFDLDFPGGTPGQLVEMVSRAQGKQVSVVFPENSDRARMPVVRVRNATVSDVFSAIAAATRHEVAVPTSIIMANGKQGAQSIQYRSVQSQFVPSGGAITDDTVWSFVSNEDEAAAAKQLNQQQPVRELRHFQLRQYLSDKLTVQDITTAIRSGWEMLKVENPPDLKFHQETGILIAAGAPELLEQIPMVLQQLPEKEPQPEPTLIPGGIPGVAPEPAK